MALEELRKSKHRGNEILEVKTEVIVKMQGPKQ